jgi:hypothetical protein
MLSLKEYDLRQVESRIREELELNGRIMVRSLDKIHAKTGLAYSVISEMADRIWERRARSMPK